MVKRPDITFAELYLSHHPLLFRSTVESACMSTPTCTSGGIVMTAGCPVNWFSKCGSQLLQSLVFSSHGGSIHYSFGVDIISQLLKDLNMNRT